MLAPQRNGSRLIAGLLFASSVAWSGGAFAAAAWETTPRLELGTLYDDNYSLTPVDGNEIDVSGLELDAQVDFRAKSQISEFFLTPRVRGTYLPDESELDSENYYLPIGYSSRGERTRTNLRAEYVHESVFDSEQPSAGVGGGDDLGGTDGGDSGRIIRQNELGMLRFNGNMELALTQRTRLRVEGRYANADFEDTVPGAQVDYEDLGGALGLAFDLTRTGTLTVAGLVSHFEPDSLVRNESDSVGMTAEWSNRFSETGRYYWRGGFQKTEFDALPGVPDSDSEDTSFIAGMGYRGTFEVTQLFADYTRSVNPNSSGRTVYRDQVRFQVVRAFSAKLAGTAALRGTKDRAVGEDANFQNRRYVTGSLGLEWRMKRSLSFAAVYDLAWQKYEDEDDKALSNAVNLSLVYEPRRRD